MAGANVAEKPLTTSSKSVQLQLQIVRSYFWQLGEAMELESPEQLSATARQAINTTGRRMTPQRSALLEIIQQSEEHLDADEIHRRARERGERISLSTVYRTLGLLKQLQLVDELHLWDEHHHYESRTAKEHCHLLCRVCGGVTEISGVVVEKMKGLASRQHGFQIERSEIDFVGLCEGCRDAEARGREDAGAERQGDGETAGRVDARD